MHQEQQDVLFRRQLEDPHPHRRFLLEREAVAHRGGQARREPGLPDPFDVDPDSGVARLQHLLVRPAVVLREDRPQGFVPLRQVAHGRPQRGHVKGPEKPPEQRNVVGGARTVNLVEDPQPLLGE